MTKFTDFLNEQLGNPEFKAEYDKLEEDFAYIQFEIANRSNTDKQ